MASLLSQFVAGTVEIAAAAHVIGRKEKPWGG